MNIKDFPEWKPMRSTVRLFDSRDISVRKKAIRNSASSFISKPEVRKMVFGLKGDKCYICGDKATQIDHKISAYSFAVDRSLDIRQMNSFDNLFPICRSCNAGKL